MPPTRQCRSGDGVRSGRAIFSLSLLRAPGHSEGRPLLLLATYGGACVTEPFHTRNPRGETGSAAASGGGSRFRQIIAVHKRIQSWIDGRPGARLPSGPELIGLGTTLFETLLPGRIRRLYDLAVGREPPGGLAFVLGAEVPWLADAPWELAYDPGRGSFIAIGDALFLRNSLSAVPVERWRPRPGPLRILVVVAQPTGAAPLSAAEEELTIRRGFETLVAGGAVEIEVLMRATPGRLQQRLVARDCDVVHVIGHGELDAETNLGQLLFEDEDGCIHRIDARALRAILCQRGVRMVFLNACETGRGGRADFSLGLAPQLVDGGLPAVVANQYKVRDASATAFAQVFYAAVANGLGVAEAAREARIAVSCAGAWPSIDWAVPVLYARDPSLRLCAPAADAANPPLSPAAEGADPGVNRCPLPSTTSRRE